MNQPVVEQLLALGVQPGGLLVVHTAFSKLSPKHQPLAGGPEGLIQALQDALGPHGTLVMPSMSDDDEHPFEPARTPCEGMGVVANTFWRLPSVLRSDSPHAFAARGPLAADITAPHPPEVPHGLDSPVGRVYTLNGQVLLLGVGHDGNTTIHLAEQLAHMRYLQPKYLTLLQDGQPVRLAYEELDHCCENFSKLDDWLEARGLQARGPVAHGQARLMRARDVVDVALQALQQDETVFLHPVGACDECDGAREAMILHPSSHHPMLSS